MLGYCVLHSTPVNRVFQCLCRAKRGGFPGGNLNGFARRRIPASSGWPFLDREFTYPRQDGFVALCQGFADTLAQRVKECLGVDFGLSGAFCEGFDQFFLGAHEGVHWIRVRVEVGKLSTVIGLGFNMDISKAIG